MGGSHRANMTLAEVTTGLNNAFLFFCAVLVLLMHVGFAMLEAGAVQAKNRSAILLKNVFALATAGICWYLFGFQVAFGASGHGGFLGTDNSDPDKTFVALADLPHTGTALLTWFFQFAFAATAATIVSGAVAERVSFRGYLIFATALTTFIYPVVVYWNRSSKGWLINAGHENTNGGFNNGTTGYWAKFGYVDLAGSGTVHLVGATAALVASIIMGPRKYMDMGVNADGETEYGPRFDEDGTVHTAAGTNDAKVFTTLGAMILWIGWDGFNCGSVLTITTTQAQEGVGMAAVNTTLCPCAAVIVYSVLAMATAYVDLSGVLNVALCGLVSITAGCPYVMPWAAICIGVVAVPVYVGASYALKKFKVDDVVDAIPVHGAGGIWGVLAVGLVGNPDLINNYLGRDPIHDAGILYNGNGSMLGWQCIAILATIAWVGVLSAIICGALHYGPPMAGLGESWLRVTEEEEKEGFDAMIKKMGATELSTPAPEGAAKEGPEEPEKDTEGTAVEMTQEENPAQPVDQV